MLFSLIDNIVISSVATIKNTELDNKSKRTSNAEKLTNVLMENLPANFHYYHLCNIGSCLTIVFQNAHNFTIDENVVNRNYISHGMSTKPITKKDCVQLFLLYRNFLVFIKDVTNYLEKIER